MARRSFAPALRSLLAPETKVVTTAQQMHPLGEGVTDALARRSLNTDAESKTISVIGGAYTSTTHAGHTYGGLNDRAAGYDLESVVVDGYEQVVWLYKGVNFIGGHFARLPFVIGKGRGTDSEETLDEHPLYRVLNKQANPLETGYVFRKRLSAHVLLSKRGAFVEVTKSRAGRIVRLDLLSPERVLPIPDPEGNYLLRFDYTERNGYVRPILPEKVRWIRDPHPFDPFSGNTPVDPAGNSLELDRLYRAYQTSFIKNDARPGGIVGVDADTLSDSEMQRVESRFAPGAHNAGMLSVIATGPGGLRYVDTTTRPRDMAYGEGMQAAKETILASLGLGESLFGNAAGRTFDNAEQEAFNAWSETLLPHFDLITSAFDQDVDEEWDPYIDTSSVGILDLPRRKKREEARAEVEAGLRSVNEYRPLAGLEPIDNPYARALWISPSKAPIPFRPEDAAALGLTGPGAVPPGGVPAAAGDPALPPDATAVDAVAAARQAAGGIGIPTDPTAAGAVAQARGLDPTGAVDDGTAEAAVTAARAVAEGVDDGEAAAAVADAREPQVPGMEGKALEQGPGAAPASYEPTDAEAVKAELAIAAALDVLLARQQAVIAARLESPKTRKGTRFWTPDSATDVRGGQQPIDAAKVVDAQRWVDETVDTMRPLVEQYGVTAAAGLLTAFAAAGVLASAPAAAEDVADFVPEAAQASVPVMLGMLVVAAEAMREWLADVEKEVEVGQLTAETIDDLVVTVKALYTDRTRDFTESLAISLSQGTVNGARDAAASAMTPLPGQLGERTVGIVREWVSQRDDRVRPSHKDADGTRLPVGQSFIVGGFELRYPNDPSGPPQETRGCRCRAHYSSVKSARFIVPPVG